MKQPGEEEYQIPGKGLSSFAVHFGEVIEAQFEDSTLVTLEAWNGPNPYRLIVGWKRSEIEERERSKFVWIMRIPLDEELRRRIRRSIGGTVIFYE